MIAEQDQSERLFDHLCDDVDSIPVENLISKWNYRAGWFVIAVDDHPG